MECPSPDELLRIVDRTASDATRARVAAHIEDCALCRQTIYVLGETAAEASPVVDARILARGSFVGRYRIDRTLGAGGMGVVYVARDPELDRDVAVKLVRRASVDSVERMRREARALATLSHPNVVTVHDVGKHGDGMFIAMEYVDGASLRGWLAARSRSWHEVVAVAVSIGRGLEAAHAAGLVHRDIKPDNVLVGDDGRIRVGDFGLVGAVPSGVPSDDPGLTLEGTVLGTPAYMAPEQLIGYASDAHSDQWSFCATIFEAVYGVRPFADEPAPDMMPSIPRGTRVPRWLRRILVRGLAFEPAARWPSMTELCDALATGARTRRRLVAATVAIAVAAVAGLAWSATRPVPFDCARAGDVPVSAWNPIRRANVGIHSPAALVDADQWTAKWSAAQIDACVVHRDDDVRREARRTCLDDELPMFDHVVSRWERGVSTIAALDFLREHLPPVTRCNDEATPITLAQQIQSRSMSDAVARAMDVALDGDRPSAIVLATNNLATAKSLDDPAVVVEAGGALALHHGLNFDDLSAEPAVRVAFDAAEASHDTWSKLRLGAWLVGILARTQRVTEARRTLGLIDATARALGPADGVEALLADTEAELSYDDGNLVGAIAARRRALALRRQRGDHREIATSLGLLANLVDLVDAHEAAALRDESDSELRHLGLDPSTMIEQQLVRLGGKVNGALARADFHGAIDGLRETIPLAERAHADGNVIAGLYDQRGTWELMIDDFARALPDFQRALELWRTVDRHDDTVATTLANAAYVALELGKPDDALALARRAVEVSQALGPAGDDDLALDRVLVGRALFAKGDPRAREPLEQAVAWAQQHGSGARRGRARFALAKLLWAGERTDRVRAIDLARAARLDLGTPPDKGPTPAWLPRMTERQHASLVEVDVWLRDHTSP